MSYLGTRDQPREYPPIGGDPQKIVDLVTRERWTRLDGSWEIPKRQVLENFRMLEGKHWYVYEQSTGRYIDVVPYFSPDDRLWRQRPTFPFLSDWHTLTVAKLTENRPKLAFLPSTPDESDADLAEIMDPIYDYLWTVTHMDYHVDELCDMVAVAGSAIIKSIWNPMLGELWEARGPAPYVVLDDQGRPVPDAGGQPMVKFAENAPMQFTPEGQPVPMIESTPGGGFSEVGAPVMMRSGEIDVSVLNPMQVRYSLAKLPFHKQPWYVERSMYTVDEVRERWGYELEPEKDQHADLDIVGGNLLGRGFGGPIQSSVGGRADHDMIVIYQMWEQPRPDAPDGRHAVTTRSKLLVDGPNPYHPTFRPYQRADFIFRSNRMIGKSPIEDMSPLVRVYNRMMAQRLESTNRNANPITLVDASQISAEEFTNRPAQVYSITRRTDGVPPVETLESPDLPVSHLEAMRELELKIRQTGSFQEGSQASVSDTASSGEHQKELRARDDRYLSKPAKSVIDALARAGHQWQKLLRIGWPEKRIIAVVGDDQVATYLRVKKDMFMGNVHVKGVAESMLPESRAERQQRLDWWLEQQVISPEQYFDLFNHPHLARAAHPGGVDKEMASFENKLLMGGQLPILLPFHDDLVHLDVHRRIAASKTFYDLDELAQQVFLLHIRHHEEQFAMKEAAMAEAEAENESQEEGEDGSEPANEDG